MGAGRNRIDGDPEINSPRTSENAGENEVSQEESRRLTTDQDNAEEDCISFCDYHDLPPPPDGGYGWVIVFASFMCNMIVDGIAYTFGIFLSDMMDYYSESKGKTAWVGSLLSGMYLSAGPLVSALTNKFGCRVVCVSGSIISTLAFVCSIFSPTVNWLMLTYGFIGGIGFGLIYLPAVVCVGYYFEKYRSLATGLAVCGSGVGTFAFAPLATFLLEMYGWKGANLILAGLILNCVLFGALMRPLEYPKGAFDKPLLQRMAEERRIQMERGSVGGSYFMVQLPDGTMEKRMKQPLNIDPGVHSSLNLDQLGPGTPITPIPTVPTLPTITEVKLIEHNGSVESVAHEENNLEIKPSIPQVRVDQHKQEKENKDLTANSKLIPRNASQPAFTTHVQGLPKNGSVPTFDRIRKTSVNDRFKPTLVPIKSNSRNVLSSNGDMRKNRNNSTSSFISRKNNSEVDVESLAYTSKLSLSREKANIVRPLSRKDIFYSGSILNLKEYHSQKSLTNYRQSIVSISRPRTGMTDTGDPSDICPCLALPESFTSAAKLMMDMSLLKDPVFLLIGVSNFFGMAGLYVPFVYLVDCAKINNINSKNASFLASIIGITNTFGRIICGYFADLPQVDALLVNNICLVISTISVAATPFCYSYGSYITVAIFFGIAISGYISATSIILVDLLGLDKLTNAFGLLILFRGAAAIVGSPLAGALYDATSSFAVPFYVAGGLFGISAITSFVAPCLKKFSLKKEEIVAECDVLTPIDEDEEDEDDGPITIGGKSLNKTAKCSNSSEIKQIESVL